MPEAALGTEGAVRTSAQESEGRRLRKVLLRNLILTGVLLSGLGILFQRWVSPPEERAQRRSSFSTRADGFRGVHDVARTLAYRVSRNSDSFGALPKPAEGYTLLVIDPLPSSTLAARSQTRLGPAQLRALKDWIETGGQAVIAMSGRSVFQMFRAEIDTSGEVFSGGLQGGPADLVPGLLGSVAPVSSWTPMQGTLRGLGPLAGYEQPVSEIDEDASHLVGAYLRRGGEYAPLVRFVDVDEGPLELLAFASAELAAELEPVLQLGEQTIAASLPMGSGRLWLVSSSYPFTNMGMARGAWAPPVFALLDQATERGARELLVDEYTHGLFERKGLIAFVAETPLRYPLGVLALLTVLVGWRGSVRVGPPTPTRTVDRRAKEEFVISLADLALRAERHGAAARWLHDALRHRLPGAGVSPEVDRLVTRLGRPFSEQELVDYAAALEAAADEHEHRGHAARPRNRESES